MKTITIVAIIAAVAIVGAACIGIPLSGVLNGGTTGPGGDDPVVPTDPVDPTPTETPTETPTQTPTDSSMSYFSPMTSSGSSSSSSGSGSGSGGSSTPEHVHTFSDAWTNDTNKHWHASTCSHDVIDGEEAHVYTGESPCTEVSTCTICNYEKAAGTHTLEMVGDDETQWKCKYCDFAVSYVAKIGSAYYETLDAALTASEAGEIVTLLADLTIEAGPEKNIIIDKAITIDGNSKTITRSFNDVVNSEGYGDYEAVFQVTAEDVTIKNVNFKQATVAKKDEAFIYVATGSNTLTVSGNTFTGIENSGLTGVNTATGAAISEITISNNEFSSMKYAAYFNNVDDADVSGNTVDGTQYNAFNLAGGTATFTDNTLTQIATADYSYLEYNSGIAVCGTSVATITGGSIELANENGVDIFAGVNIGDVYYGPGVTSISLYTAEDMFAFADMVNTKEETFAGKTVILMDNIDLENKEWTPIGQTGSTTFSGIFDGNEKTISNLKVDRTAITSVHDAAGLFGFIEEHTTPSVPFVIKDLTIKNADIKGNKWAGGVVGYVNSNAIPYAIQNCHVVDSTIQGGMTGEQVGGIIGHLAAGGTISDCSVENTKVYYTSGKEAEYQLAGAVVGWVAAGATYGDGNSFTGVTINDVVTTVAYNTP